MVGETVTTALEAEAGASADKAPAVPLNLSVTLEGLDTAFSETYLQTHHRQDFARPWIQNPVF